ncbi:ATP-binding cassette domain-containing protein [Methylobacterium sp. NI91]|nr:MULTISPECIES: ABC transporter ATP-binding protein [unclassified Methylobacterium]QIJ75958.1 ATP-binding cassette domain-containing protein [Methylobacterium sp. CLZ]QIJ80860.1 ATP-binding cassette domain-containing protein [Methylobacterium sp. NI91]
MMRTEDTPLAAVEGAAFAYRGRAALHRLDLTLVRGTTLALLGPNGAGKTSLIRLLAGRLRPDAGSVRVLGGDPHADRATRRKIGFVPQEIALYPRLTVAENLDVFARLAGLKRDERCGAVAAAIGRCALLEVAGRVVATLSGGYKRRVNIAASLLASPDLILLDEPTQGVDLEARAAIHAVLAGLRAAGAGLVVSTHDFSEAERLADRVAILADGRIRLTGPLAALMRPLEAAPPEHEAVLEGAPDAAAEAALRRSGFAPLRGDARFWRADHGAAGGLDGAALLVALRANGVPAAEIRVRRPGLETLYRDALAEGPSLETAA